MGSLTPPLGYLPQYLSELAGTVLGVVFAGFGLFFLITGRAPQLEYERFNGWRIRALGGAQIVLGVIVVALSFLTNAEPPSHGGSHWGDSTDLVITGIWLVIVGGIVTLNIRRITKYWRHGN